MKQPLDVAGARALLDEVRALMGGMRPALGVRDMSPMDGHILWLYARVWSAVGAIAVLLREAYLDAAVGLARGLFTDMLRLLELDRRGEDRTALVLGWANEAIDDIEGLITEAATTGVDPDPGGARRQLAERRAAIERARQKCGIGRLLTFPSDKDLASTHGLMKEFVDYRLGHLFVHGSPAVMGFRSVKTSDGVFGFAERQEGASEMMIGVALMAAECGLRSMQAFCRVFRIEEPPRVSGLLANIEAEAVGRNERLGA